MKLNKKTLKIGAIIATPLLLVGLYIAVKPMLESKLYPPEPENAFLGYEEVTFKLELGRNQDTITKITSLFVDEAHAAEEQLVLNETSDTYESGDLKISSSVTWSGDQDGLSEYGSLAQTQIEKESDSTYLITVKSDDANFKPGGYTLDVEVTSGDEEPTKISQDFSWGVLAMNTNKSVYSEGETATIAMAVLDEVGEMVCDADVTLTITDPNDNEVVRTTEDNSIRISPNCTKKEYIQVPDYETKYIVGTPGEYSAKLVAVTENGAYGISDKFEVWDYVPFDIERTTATRIYPPVSYPVKINIKANEDFKGTIEERVPAQFEIVSNHSGLVIREYGGEDQTGIRFVQKAEYFPDSDTATISDEDGYKILNWQADLKKGDEFQIEYSYEAPQISPEFYLLGPLKLLESGGQERFSEIRRWQIAADVIAYITSGAQGTRNVTSTSVTIGSVVADDLLVFYCGTQTSNTITGPAWNEVYNVAGTPTQGSWWTISAGGSESPSCSWSGNDHAGSILLEYDGVDTSSALDTNNVATGSGDGSVECPSVTPSAGNHLYVSGLIFNNGTTFTWPSFTERQDVDSASGSPGARSTHSAADLISTGSQNDTPTVDDSDTGAWSCQTLAFNEEVIADDWEGIAYQDDVGETAVADSTEICAAVNQDTPDCSTTTSGVFTISNGDALAGDQLTFFINGGSLFGNTVTVGDGGDIVTSDKLRIYQNHVVVRHEQGSNITIDQMKIYDDADNSTDMLFAVTDASPDLLSVEGTYELFVDNDYTFQPTGNVTQVHDVQINGIWTAQAGETVNADGSFNLVPGGQFTPSTSTVTFDATTGTEAIYTAGTGPMYNVIVDDSVGSLTLQVQDPIDIDNNLTILDGTVDVVTGENNQVGIGASFTNNDIFTAQSGTVLMDGTSGYIAGTTDTSFYNLTIDPTSAGTVTLSASDPTVTNTLNVGVGDSFSIGPSRILTHSYNNLTLNGDLVGAGTYNYTAAGNMPTSGTINADVRYNGSGQSVAARTFGGDLELFNDGAGDKTYTLGTGGAQTVTVSGNFETRADGDGNITVQGSTNDPDVTITGNLDFTGTGGGTEQVTSGTGDWTVSGNVDFTGGTYTASSGNALIMNGTAMNITSNTQPLQNFTVSGGTVSSADDLDIDANFYISGGSFSQGPNFDLIIGGNFTLDTGVGFGNVLPSGTGLLYFDGTTTYTDSTTPLQDIGNVRVGSPP